MSHSVDELRPAGDLQVGDAIAFRLGEVINAPTLADWEYKHEKSRCIAEIVISDTHTAIKFDNGWLILVDSDEMRTVEVKKESFKGAIFSHLGKPRILNGVSLE